MIRKRIGLFKYNVQLKRQLGLYNPSGDVEMFENHTMSLNLFDFTNKSDVYLLDSFTDASQYGGESVSEFSHETDHYGNKFCKHFRHYDNHL